MKIRKLVAGAAALATASSLALAGQAQAADTTAYFTITGVNSLAVSAPAPAGGVDLGSVTSTDLLAGGSPTVGGSLGDVTVTDERGSLVASWTAKVTSSEFVHETANADGTVAAEEKVTTANILYSSGLGTVTGTGVFTPSVALPMNTPELLRNAGTFAGVGANSVTWDPTLTITLLTSQVAGKYTGTITHSVA